MGPLRIRVLREINNEYLQHLYLKVRRAEDAHAGVAACLITLEHIAAQPYETATTRDGLHRVIHTLREIRAVVRSLPAEV